MTSQLEKAFDYYIAHQDEIVSKYDGKFVVIRQREVIGAYDEELEAIQETQKEHRAGTFLVQYVSRHAAPPGFESVQY